MKYAEQQRLDEVISIADNCKHGTIRYGDIDLLVKAVKELRSKVERLKKKLAGVK